jgi:hypothetical protein
MKPTLLALSVLLVIAVPVPAQRTPDAQLSIRLRSDKDSYSLRGGIHLEIIRENTSANQLLVCRQWGWGIARTEVHVFDATGKEVHTDFMADELPPPPQPYDFVLLSSGEFIGTRLEEPAKHFVTNPAIMSLSSSTRATCQRVTHEK